MSSKLHSNYTQFGGPPSADRLFGRPERHPPNPLIVVLLMRLDIFFYQFSNSLPHILIIPQHIWPADNSDYSVTDKCTKHAIYVIKMINTFLLSTNTTKRYIQQTNFTYVLCPTNALSLSAQCINIQ